MARTAFPGRSGLFDDDIARRTARGVGVCGDLTRTLLQEDSIVVKIERKYSALKLA